MEILRSPARSKLQPLVTDSCYICDYPPLDLGQKRFLAGPVPVGPGPHWGIATATFREFHFLRTWMNKDEKKGMSILPRPSWAMGTYCLG
jgi:hypothetical protein